MKTKYLRQKAAVSMCLRLLITGVNHADRYLINICEERSRLASFTTRRYRITKSNATTRGTARAATCPLESRLKVTTRATRRAAYYQTSAEVPSEF